MQDLIQKGMLQYAKGTKDVMGDPFPKVEVNMVTASASKARKFSSKVERQKQVEESDAMETDEESHKSKKWESYLCLRCNREVKSCEAVIAEKEHKAAFSKSGIRFNTMGGNDLQIYVGPKRIYEGIDPGIFVPIESAHCYGPDDGPFLFKGMPVISA